MLLQGPPRRGGSGSVPMSSPTSPPQLPWTTSSHSAGRAMRWPCGCGWTTPRTTSTRGERALQGWGLCWALVSAVSMERQGQMAGRSSSPLEEVTASLRHEAKHPLATSSRPQPGISWAGAASPVPVVAAVSPGLVPVSLSPLWGAPWRMGGHTAGTAGLGVVGATLCAQGSAPHSPFEGSHRTVGSSAVLTAIQEHVWARLGAWSICLQCVSWHSVTPQRDPSQAMALAFWTRSRQMASLGQASLPLLGVPGTWSSPRPTERAQGTVLCWVAHACRATVGTNGVCCARGLERGWDWGAWAGGEPGLQQPLCQFLISI